MLKNLSKILKLKKQLEHVRPEYDARPVSESRLLAEAQRLHAKIYLERGFINQEEIGTDGRIKLSHDPYRNHSIYFAATKKEPGETDVTVATVRMIVSLPGKGHNSFPTLDKLAVYPEMLAKIKRNSHTSCVEISGLAKVKGHSSYVALLLYRAMWQYSITKEHRLWLMACDSNVYSRLKLLFGNALAEIGDETFYMGSNVIPALLDVDRSLEEAARATSTLNPVSRKFKRLLLGFFLRGLSVKYLSEEQVQILKKHNLRQYVASDAKGYE